MSFPTQSFISSPRDRYDPNYCNYEDETVTALSLKHGIQYTKKTESSEKTDKIET
jgi:hypothetical protein